jgi:Gamma-glutamyl cyclotransferase, AIG2-like
MASSAMAQREDTPINSGSELRETTSQRGRCNLCAPNSEHSHAIEVRRVTSRAELDDYIASLIAIRDPAFAAMSGKTHRTIAQRSTNLTDEVPGTVFEITAQELAAADRYEVSEYTRVLVTLKSGARAWVYVRA